MYVVGNKDLSSLSSVASRSHRFFPVIQCLSDPRRSPAGSFSSISFLWDSFPPFQLLSLTFLSNTRYFPLSQFYFPCPCSSSWSCCPLFYLFLKLFCLCPYFFTSLSLSFLFSVVPRLPVSPPHSSWYRGLGGKKKKVCSGFPFLPFGGRGQRCTCSCHSRLRNLWTPSTWLSYLPKRLVC